MPFPGFVNLSTRAVVQTGDKVLIGGFIVKGAGKKSVLVDVLGPSIAAGTIPGLLADPVLELHKPDGTVISNDNWKDTPRIADLLGTGIPPTHDLEPAVFDDLEEGPYTVVVKGKNGATGGASRGL